jgi:phytoene synthase
VSDERLAEAYVHCEAIARAYDRDRWIAALFAPAENRKHLHALSAFAYEMGRVGALVREPLAGEMRLTWWLEAIEGARSEEARQSPIAAALLDTIESRRLPREAFTAWLLAERDALYEAAPTEPEAVAGLGRATRAPLFALSARALGGEAQAAAGPAGAAAALARRGLFADARREIGLAEAALGAVSTEVAPAFATLAALELDARRGLSGKPPASAWRRQLAIWWWGRRR